MGLLAKPPRGGLLTRRGGIFAVVTGLHVLGLVLAAQARSRVEPAPQPVLLKVAFLNESTPVEPPPALPPPTLAPPPPVAIVVPLVDIPVIEVPEVRTLAAEAAPPPSLPLPTPVMARSEEPVMLDIDQVDYIQQPELRYPRAAKQARLQGTVQCWVLIDPEGRPSKVRLHRSSGHDQLDREACDAVTRVRFKPYRLQGEARSAQVIVPFEFKLTDRTARRR